MTEEPYKLPPGWRWVNLGEVCQINPRRPRLNRAETAATSFVPMDAVDDGTGAIKNIQPRPFAEVRRGYTYFEEGDVLFAKITPCMENGKAAIAEDLTDGIGFGSTEFHVLRPQPQVLAQWIWLFVRQERFRAEAKRTFHGAVGHQRVHESFLEIYPVPLPPLEEQRRITAHLGRVQTQVTALKQAQDWIGAELKHLEQAILDKAFRGEM